MTKNRASAVTDKPAASPEDLLRTAVSGAKAPAASAAAKPRRPDGLTAGVAGAALALGILVGAGTAILAAPKVDSGVALADLGAGLEAVRGEASRLGGEVARLGKAVADLRETAEAAHGEAKAGRTTMLERLAKAEQALGMRVAALGERLELGDREQATRFAALAAQVEKQPQIQAAQAAPPKPGPVQTGSIPEARVKPTVIETWAVRDVYDGTAMLEDRRRRLVEVGAGGTIPGLGRVEAVERRGREWVVVTRHGIVTPQPW